MHILKNQAAQGDMLITKITDLPDDLIPAKSENGVFVCAHSETGHNHVVEADGVKAFNAANDPFVMYLVVDNTAKLEHLRSFDTHSPISIPPGVYRINRQREYTPEGFRRAAD